jgi:hypothetical protein
MPIHDILILGLIIGTFTTFAAVLGGLTWYCSDKRKRKYHHVGHRDYGFPVGGSLIDDD